jgi:hypothetical protein
MGFSRLLVGRQSSRRAADLGFSKLVVKEPEASHISNPGVVTDYEVNGLSVSMNEWLHQDHLTATFPTYGHQTDSLLY